MSEVRVLADTNDACGEGPLWDADQSLLYWVDITHQRLHRLDWVTKKVTTVDAGAPVSALAILKTGGLLLCGTDGIWSLQENSGARPLLRQFNDAAIPINDAIVDPAGRLLIGTSYFDGSDFYPGGQILCVDLDGRVSQVDSGFKLANGMGFSPDCATLYITDSVVRCIYAYDYDKTTAAATSRRVFVQANLDEGLPDGLTVDADGFVWSAQWFGGCVCRYDPDGSLERRVSVPAQQTSSIAFGGPHLTDLFVTSAALADALSLAPSGYRVHAKSGGSLFHMNLGIPGKLEFRCSVIAPRS